MWPQNWPASALYNNKASAVAGKFVVGVLDAVDTGGLGPTTPSFGCAAVWGPGKEGAGALLKSSTSQ